VWITPPTSPPASLSTSELLDAIQTVTEVVIKISTKS
jgi:hypothetical protein